MTPLPAAFGETELVAWRLDAALHAATWSSGEGAYRVGGRWNSKGNRAVYCSIDPSTAILEVAVHKGFRALDITAHVMTSVVVTQPARFHVVRPQDVPNANWLRPGIPSAGQQAFGDDLLARHGAIVIPSAVSPESWNMILHATTAGDLCTLREQRPFALDTRLHPPATA